MEVKHHNLVKLISLLLILLFVGNYAYSQRSIDYQPIADLSGWYGAVEFIKLDVIKVHASIATWNGRNGERVSAFPNWQGKSRVTQELIWGDHEITMGEKYLSDESWHLSHERWKDPKIRAELGIISTNGHLESDYRDMIDIRRSKEKYWELVDPDGKIKKVLKYDLNGNGKDEIIIVKAKPLELQWDYDIRLYIFTHNEAENEWRLDYKFSSEIFNKENDLVVGVYSDLEIVDVDGDDLPEILLYYASIGGNSQTYGVLIFSSKPDFKFLSYWNDGGVLVKIRGFEDTYQNKPWDD